MSARFVILHFCKYIGLFALARFLTRNSVRILCYHGFSFADEHEFRPALFLTPEVFSRRLEWISKNNFEVISLESATRQLADNKVKPYSLVITIDDGFYGVYAFALPLLARYRYPSTLYLTSYYSKHPYPVFRLVMQYLFWKTKVDSWDFSEFDAKLPVNVRTTGEKGIRDLWTLIEYGEAELDEQGRDELLKYAAAGLNIDYDEIRSQRLFELVTPNEVRKLRQGGMDVQLHTHRHHMPDEEFEICYEIEQNRHFLAEIISEPRVHFCYPSGVFSEDQLPVLAGLGIKTATTCESGLNTPRTNRLLLHRFLDQMDIPEIEFEAELTGFKDLAKWLHGFVRSVKHL